MFFARWLDGLEDRLPAGAYFPFGDGPRRCIGQGFATLEAAIVIGTLAQRVRFQLVPGHQVEPEPLVTLRPRNGMRMSQGWWQWRTATTVAARSASRLFRLAAQFEAARPWTARRPPIH